MSTFSVTVGLRLILHLNLIGILVDQTDAASTQFVSTLVLLVLYRNIIRQDQACRISISQQLRTKHLFPDFMSTKGNDYGNREIREIVKSRLCDDYVSNNG